MGETDRVLNDRLKKLIYFGIEAMLALQKSKSERVIEGRLIYGTTSDGNKGWMFIPYNRKPRSRKKDKLLRRLLAGWIKLSPNKLKVFASVNNKVSPQEAVKALKQDICNGLDELLKDEHFAQLTPYEEQ